MLIFCKWPFWWWLFTWKFMKINDNLRLKIMKILKIFGIQPNYCWWQQLTYIFGSFRGRLWLHLLNWQNFHLGSSNNLTRSIVQQNYKNHPVQTASISSHCKISRIELSFLIFQSFESTKMKIRSLCNCSAFQHSNTEMNKSVIK